MNSAVGPLEEKFAAAWSRLCPKSLGAGVLIAVSGGADSMVLAELLRKAGEKVALAHVNFGLRGDASDGDEAFVQRWADGHGVPCYSTRYDTAAEAAERGKGIQETARELRYRWFSELLTEHGLSAVLTAHHADDNAETVLMNLFRGAGLNGLGGIPEISGTIIRPLLSFKKSALLEYAASAGVGFREDASNATDDYLRNAVRHSLMPILDNLFPDPAARLSGTATRLREAGILYRESVDRHLARLTERRGTDVYIPVRKLRHAEPLLTLCHEIFSPAGVLPAQLPQIIALMDAESGRFVASPTHRVIRHRDHLVLAAFPAGEADLILLDSIPGTCETVTHRYEVREAIPPAAFPPDPDTAWLDADLLTGPLILRRTRAGDYFYPLGMERKKKKVARFLTSLKVARHEKEAAWVLECDKKIAWVAGYRIDDRFKISARTARAICVERHPHPAL